MSDQKREWRRNFKLTNDILLEQLRETATRLMKNGTKNTTAFLTNDQKIENDISILESTATWKLVRILHPIYFRSSSDFNITLCV